MASKNIRFDTEEAARKFANRNLTPTSKKKKKEPKTPIPSEHEEQKSLIYWCEVMENKYPDLDLIYAVPNGGLRNKTVAAQLSAEGVKPGVPDLFLPVPKGEYHGLYLEMKRSDGGNGTSENQDKWIRRLKSHGYCVKIPWGFDQARTIITWYYSLGEFKR